MNKNDWVDLVVGILAVLGGIYVAARLPGVWDVVVGMILAMAGITLILRLSMRSKR